MNHVIKEVTMNETQKKTENKPIKMVRKGAVAASIWKRQSPSGFEYFDFSLSRAWKSKNAGKEGYSPNFFANNREDLLLVIQDAACWILDHDAGLLAGDPESLPAVSQLG